MYLQKNPQKLFFFTNYGFDVTKPKRGKKNRFEKSTKNAKAAKWTMFCNQHVNKP